MHYQCICCNKDPVKVSARVNAVAQRLSSSDSHIRHRAAVEFRILNDKTVGGSDETRKPYVKIMHESLYDLSTSKQLNVRLGAAEGCLELGKSIYLDDFQVASLHKVIYVLFDAGPEDLPLLETASAALMEIVRKGMIFEILEAETSRVLEWVSSRPDRTMAACYVLKGLLSEPNGNRSQYSSKPARKIDVLIITHIADLLKQLWGAIKRTDDKGEVSLISDCIGHLIHSSVSGDPAYGVQRVETFCSALLMSINANLVSNAKGSERVITAMAHLVDFLPEKLINVTVAAALSAPPTPPLARLIAKIVLCNPAKFSGLSAAAMDFCFHILEKKTVNGNRFGKLQRNSMITPSSRISISTQASEAKSAANMRSDIRHGLNNSMLITTDLSFLDDSPTLQSLFKIVNAISSTAEGVQSIRERLPRLKACIEFNGTLAALKLASAFCTLDKSVNIASSVKTVLHLGKKSGKRGKMLCKYAQVSQEAATQVKDALLPELLSDLSEENKDVNTISAILKDIRDFVNLDIVKEFKNHFCDLIIDLSVHESPIVRLEALSTLMAAVFTTQQATRPIPPPLLSKCNGNSNVTGSSESLSPPVSPDSSLYFGDVKLTPATTMSRTPGSAYETKKFGSLAISPDLRCFKVRYPTPTPTPGSKCRSDLNYNKDLCSDIEHRRDILSKTITIAMSDSDIDNRIAVITSLIPTQTDLSKDIKAFVLQTPPIARLIFQLALNDPNEEVRSLASDLIFTCELQTLIPSDERNIAVGSFIATFENHPNPHTRQGAVSQLRNLIHPESDNKSLRHLLLLLSNNLDGSTVEPGSLLQQAILKCIARITERTLSSPPDLIHTLSRVVQQQDVSECTEPALEGVGNVLQNMAGQHQPGEENLILKSFKRHPELYPLVVTMTKGRPGTYPIGVIRQAMRVVGIVGAIDPSVLSPLHTNTKEDMSMYDFSSAWSTVTVLLDVLVQPWNSLHHDKVLQALASVIKVLGRSRSSSQIPRIVPVLTHLLKLKVTHIRSGGKSSCQVLLHILSYVFSVVQKESAGNFEKLVEILVENWSLSSNALRNITTFGASQTYIKTLSAYSNELGSILSLLCNPLLRPHVDLVMYIPLFGFAATSLDKSGERVISIKLATAMMSLGSYVNEPENKICANLCSDALLSVLTCNESTSYVKALVVKGLQATTTRDLAAKVAHGLISFLSDTYLREQLRDGNDSCSLSQQTVKLYSSFNSASSIPSCGRHNDASSHYQGDAVTLLSSLVDKYPTEVGYLQPRITHMLQVTVGILDTVSDSVPTLANGPMTRPQQNEALSIKEIDLQYIKSALQIDSSSATHSGTTFDYSLWIDKLCLTLLKESTRPVLRTVTGVAAALPVIARRLFCISFATVYRDLHHDQPTITHNMILSVQTVLQAQSDAHVPEEVIRMLLELCDFMERVILRNERLRSSQSPQSFPSFLSSKTGNSSIFKVDIALLAESSGLYTQALRLAEACDITNATTYRQLIRLNRTLGLPEASEGIMKMVKRSDIKDPDMYADLGLWEEAYHRYKIQLRNGSKNEEECVSGMIRSLHHRGEWQRMLNLMEKYTSVLSNESQAQLSSVIIHGAWILQRWDVVARSLETGALDFSIDKMDRVTHHSFHHSFYNALLAISENRTHDAGQAICECRESLLGTQHDTLIQLQHLVELEEVIRFKDNTSHLNNIWSARSATMRSLTDVREQYDTLTLRTLAMPMHCYPDPWVDFCRKQLSKGNLDIARKAVAALETELGSGKKLFSPKCALVKCEVEWESRLSAAARFRIVATLSKLVEKFSPQNESSSNPCDRSTYDLMCCKLGHWKAELGFPLNEVFEPLRRSVHHPDYPSQSSELWLSWGLFNLRAVHRGHVTDANPNLKWCHISESVKSLSKSMQLASDSAQASVSEMQTALRLLHIAVTYLPDIKCPEEVKECIYNSNLAVYTNTWRGLIPQIVSQLGRNPPRGSHLERLIISIATTVAVKHPQQVLVRVLVNGGSCYGEVEVINFIHKSHPLLSSQLVSVTAGLKSITRLPEERWVSALSSVHRKLQADDSCKAVTDIIIPLYNDEVLINAFPEHSELFQSALSELHAWRDSAPFGSNLHRNMAKQMFMSLWRKLHSLINTSLLLHEISETLSKASDLEIEIPTRKAESGEGGVTIVKFDDVIPIIPSVQRPRRVTMVGTDGESYRFLLKRNEDLRLDERIMQLLLMANSLHLPINTFVYNVVPIASNVGLIEWVDEAEDLDLVISHTRPRHLRDQELSLLKIRTISNTSFLSCRTREYSWDRLSHAERVDSLSYLENHIPAETLQTALWIKAASTHIWHKRRTSFTLSVAVMSITGFLIGLGDRHLGNILLHSSGRVVHIDFGECFEAAMLRTTYPETVPFRLTRELRHAMGVGGVEGVFRSAAIQTNLKLREHKQAVLAMLESFINEPCVKLAGKLARPSFILQRVNDKFEGTDDLTDPSKQREVNSNTPDSNVILSTYPQILYSRKDLLSYPCSLYCSKETTTPTVVHQESYPSSLYSGQTRERVRSGDTPSQQVNRLIEAATSLDNLAILYKGWKPWL